MTVSRDVILDLLPTYFAGDASEDTRKLVETFMATDAGFAQMADRFKTLYERHPPSKNGEAAGERAAFERTRKLVDRRNEAFGGAVGFTLGAMVAVGFALFGGSDGLAGGSVIGGVFGMVAAMSWVSWYLANRQLRAR